MWCCLWQPWSWPALLERLLRAGWPRLSSHTFYIASFDSHNCPGVCYLYPLSHEEGEHREMKAWFEWQWWGRCRILPQAVCCGSCAVRRSAEVLAVLKSEVLWWGRGPGSREVLFPVVRHIGQKPTHGRRDASLEEKGRGSGPEGLGTSSRLCVVEGMRASVGTFFFSLHFILLQKTN